MMQSILQISTIKDKSSIVQRPLYQVRLGTQSNTKIERSFSSNVFRGSMFQRVLPTRKCASCGM